MLEITKLRLNYQPLDDTLRSHLVSAQNLTFSWAVQSSHNPNRQTACRVIITDDDDNTLWDSDTVSTADQCLAYQGPELPRGVMLHVAVTVSDAYRETSAACNDYFYITDIDWQAPWIASPTERPRTEALYFRRSFRLAKPLATACLYACGIGYQKVFVNGQPLDEGVLEDWPLDPAVTDYSKQAQYVVYPDIQDQLDVENCLGIIVGCGWRDNATSKRVDEGRASGVAFRGDPMLTAMLVLTYEDGTSERILTDESWTVAAGPITSNDVFNGTTFDARLDDPDWCLFGSPARDGEVAAAIKYPVDGYGKLVPMQLPPIASAQLVDPLAQWPLNDKCYLDFGQNLAGVIRLRIPAGLPAGTRIVLTHSEELNENGELYTATLRSAQACDTYIASGNEDGSTFFQPPFTYHGFRYACIEGLGPVIRPQDAVAVWLRNNLDKNSFFITGNPLINKIHECCLATERGNTHGMLTDCPQRDERMGWLNDATVRFEAFPYAFEPHAIFSKIIQDILNEQSAEGGISCTTPYVFGTNPADPVCSSFLIAGKQAWLHTGDTALLKHALPGFKAWADCLLAHSDEGIVNYSNYGDWAAPAYACDNPEGARSGVTPGIFMSTGYSYFNCRTVAEFADTLGETELAAEYRRKADFVRNAMLKKWYNAETGLFATGSMACLVFPLWLGIYPADTAAAAARKLNDDLIAADYKFTTGNLCTRYLFEVLCDYGYTDTAYQLICKDTYPSFGFMIQQEATTIWERFELKKHAGMNSHNHPMYGAIYHWFYAYLAGINFTSPACETVTIKPFFPSGLMSVHCGVETVRGMLTVRWFKRYDKLHLLVNVPFGMTASVEFNGRTYVAGSGFSSYEA